MTHAYRLNFSLTKFFGALYFAGLITGCVTVNVNFPESAVQKASDDFVKDLYRAKEKPKAPSNSSSFSLISTAYADDEVFSVNTPGANAIKARMLDRLNGSLLKFKADGFVGERADGLLEIRGEPASLLRKKIESVVNEENKDRKQLYDELKAANPRATPELIRKSFSKSFQAESPSGSFVESAPGTWEQKR